MGASEASNVTNAGNGNFPTVATLYKATKNGPVAIGQYHNTYRIDVTNPSYLSRMHSRRRNYRFPSRTLPESKH